MNVVSFQELRYTALMIWPLKLSMMTSAGVSSSKDMSICHIWQDDVFNILDHGLLVGPVLGGVSDIPIRWELIVWVTAVGCTFVDQLDWKEISCESHKAQQ